MRVHKDSYYSAKEGDEKYLVIYVHMSLSAAVQLV